MVLAWLIVQKYENYHDLSDIMVINVQNPY